MNSKLIGASHDSGNATILSFRSSASVLTNGNGFTGLVFGKFGCWRIGEDRVVDDDDDAAAARALVLGGEDDGSGGSKVTNSVNASELFGCSLINARRSLIASSIRPSIFLAFARRQ